MLFREIAALCSENHETHVYIIYLSIYLLVSIYLAVVVESTVGIWPLCNFLLLYIHSVGLLGRGISPSQGRYVHTEQHKH
jgi:hypothetical protein